ncbi:MAG: cytochrome c nitrite reductase small subunit [Desulfurivibrionaceae bacterium]
MDKKKGWRIGLIALVILGAGIVAAIFLALGPPDLLAKSETPNFCAGCHVMEAQYEAWTHAGAHRRKACVDCHLPNQSIVLHYLWKSIDGIKDVLVFYSGRVPERIEISAHGEEVVQANCIRCHEFMVTRIDQQRLCWQCHRRIAHRGVGEIQTR